MPALRALASAMSRRRRRVSGNGNVFEKRLSTKPAGRVGRRARRGDAPRRGLEARGVSGGGGARRDRRDRRDRRAEGGGERARARDARPEEIVRAVHARGDAAMRRAMGVSSRLSVVAAAEDTRGGDLGESPASPAEVDFATLVGEAAPRRHDAGDAASDGRGDTRDARDEGSPAAETAGTNTRTRAATKEKEDFDAPPTPTSSKTEDTPERKPERRRRRRVFLRRQIRKKCRARCSPRCRRRRRCPPCSP